ncbi:YggS family pyridoxal phosphate-dependent enzyme [Helicobacter cappadocius]|uniref:Pyridoxal phosphate homeostasis protein n=1 Tax=Helicobacter cappadocius TaxID=3063998 RepID=A0AA90SSV9_9HELI|nr:MULTISPECIES: YggS family pyridoxal phosphate-dependent enzyme [unclassified Helicobacter]MDO7253377.1 YggS family pyridoxal phosphate-dependent enzyme [Helicobacter sp. faydin-H75]MDP2539359.1 YggS family pyridoxal phosphate-dependent enzyme [Helicobacter sp. faydin-H76]
MLRNNLDKIISRIEKARISYSRHQIIKLIAVSKYSEISDIQAMYGCGQRAFGENKIQDLKTKSDALIDLPIQWHMIGTLQENKINALLVLKPSLLHSLDSIKLAKAIQKRCEKIQTSIKALLQVNSSYEETKSGVLPQEAREIYLEILQTCPNIKLEGIMSIGANSKELQKIESSFKITKDIFDSLQSEGAKTLSMGMSGDFEIAIGYGANMLRIGSLLFEK